MGTPSAMPGFFFVAVCLIWGATWIALKAGIAVVPPWIFAGTRFIAAGGALLAYVVARGGSLAIARADLGRLLLATVTLVVGCYALLFWGTLYISSGLSAVLNLATMPVALLAIGLLAGEETASRRKLAAIAFGTIGLAILFGPRIVGTSAGSARQIAGAAAVTGSAVSYAVGSVLARPLLRRYSAPLLSGHTIFFGGLALTALALAVEPGAWAALRFDWGREAWLGWLFLVLFGSLVAYTMYMRLLHDWGPVKAGTYAFISPIVAVLLGAVVFDERLSLVEGLGMAAMLVGAWLALALGRPPAVTAEIASNATGPGEPTFTTRA
jgi:drug/metabolite transporter (DMT)-like permease